MTMPFTIAPAEAVSDVEDVPALAEVPVTSDVTDADVTPKFDVASALDNLKSRYTKTVEGMVKHIRIPRHSDPELWIKVRPVSLPHMNLASEMRQPKSDKDKRPGWQLDVLCDVLVHSCIGVYAKFHEAPDREFSLRPGDPEGSLTVFDHDFAAAFGWTDTGSNAANCRKIFLTDGDLVTVTDDLYAWSNTAKEEADTDFLDG